MERVYDSDHDEYFLAHETKAKTKPKTQTQIKIETETKPKNVVPCWVCCENFYANFYALQTHMNKNWR